MSAIDEKFAEFIVKLDKYFYDEKGVMPHMDIDPEVSEAAMFEKKAQISQHIETALQEQDNEDVVYGEIVEVAGIVMNLYIPAHKYFPDSTLIDFYSELEQIIREIF